MKSSSSIFEKKYNTDYGANNVLFYLCLLDNKLTKTHYHDYLNLKNIL